MSHGMKLICTLVAILWGWNAAAQQITGSIRGTIIDPSGAMVPNAAIIARQTETGLSRAATTDRTGAYVLLELPIGHYQLQVEAKGFRKYFQDGLSLNVNDIATVNVHLAVGTETQQVEV